MSIRFRSPTDTPVQLTLLSGHSAVVTREWRELPVLFHAEALARRCECDTRDGVIAVEEGKVEAGPDAQNQIANVDDHYRAAITTMLDRSEDGDFTNDDLPNIKVVSALVGFRANKEDVLRVFRAMVAEATADKAAADTGA